MRVVRTIGQAFEVCHKLSQEQMQEKLQDEAELGPSTPMRAKVSVSGSMISEEEAEQIEAEDKLSAVEEVSRTPSPIRASQQPSTSTAFTAKRHSIFMPRKISSDQSSQSTAIENQPGQGPVPSSFVPLPQPQTAKVDAQGKAIPAQTAQPMQAQP
ncbi:hypothetical protein L596_019702 [Steinernema carpocapsae]|uniref:PID domain-containing protein n=1 Tax=Steinernema carpocapsae TaxID=34508 RepID=A0A4U5MRF7_STECR|nr:hypothetical protein L596_019702 [Steinernema carpocapsae]